MTGSGLVTRAPVAVIGMSGRFACARDIASLRDLLNEARDCVRPLSSERRAVMGMLDSTAFPETAFLDDIDAFDRDIFHYSKEEADCLDPEQRLLLEHSFLALQDAAIDPASLAETAVGVYVASTMPSGFADRIPTGKVYSLTGSMAALAAGRISYWLNSAGPALVINTACSSSLVAIHHAIGALRAGEVDIAVVGGFRVHCGVHDGRQLADPLGIHATDGRCRSFDAGAKGVGIGEGGAVVVLKRSADAWRDGDPVHAELLGSAVNHDGRSVNGMTAPSMRAQTAMYRQAWADAGLAGHDIGYFEAHGTGTLLGDPIEYRGLIAALAADDATVTEPAWIGSIKSNMGHLDNAAGIVGLVKAILSVEHAEVHAVVHFDQPNPHMGYQPGVLAVADARAGWSGARTRRIGGVSSFGLSGTNAHVVLGAARPPEVAAASAPQRRIIRIAGRTADEADRRAAVVAGRLGELPPECFAAFVCGMNKAQPAWPFGLSAMGEDTAAMRRDVESRQAEKVAPPVAVTILLLGEGAPGGWGKDEWVLRETVTTTWSSDIGELPAKGPALTVLQQWAAARLWMAQGVRFDAIVATGTGRITRRLLEGELTLPAALDEAAAATLVQAEPDRAKLGAALSSLRHHGPLLALASHAADPLETVARQIAHGLADVGIDHIVGDLGWAVIHRHIAAGLTLTPTPGGAARLHLPVFDLRRDRHWPAGEVLAPAASPATRAQLSAPAWRPIAPLEPASVAHDTLLVRLDPAGGLQADLLTDTPGKVKTVSHDAAGRGDGRNLTDVDQWDVLLARLDDRALIVIDDTAPGGGESAYDTVEILMAFAQAAARSDRFAMRLLAVSSGCSGPLEASGMPDKALSRGFTKVAAEEIAKLSTLHLDVTMPSNPEDRGQVHAIVAELAGAAAWPDAFLIARGSRILARRFVPLSADPDAVPAVKADGIYLITGGTGGIGLTLARDLVARVGARVALMSRHASRTDLPPDLASRETVMVIDGDVCSLADVNAARHRIELAWGTISGVIHAAGLPGGGLLRTRKAADARSVIAPKMAGARNLLAAFAAARPGFLALMSSLSCEMPAIGQADYCAANWFLDELASSATAAGLPVVSLLWSRWQETGMAAGAAAPSGMAGLAPADAVASCWQALATGLPVIAISETPVGVMRNRVAAQSVGAAEPADRQALSETLRAKAAGALAIDIVDEQDDLFDLGATSLDLIDLFEFVEAQFPGRLSVQQLLDRPTIGALLDELCGASSAAAPADIVVLELE